MKNLTVNVQIQFDQFDNGDSVEYAQNALNKMTEILQRNFDDISPIIFTQGIDSSDVEVVRTYTDMYGAYIEEGADVNVEATDNVAEYSGRVTGFRDGYVLVEDQEENTFMVEPHKVEVNE